MKNLIALLAACLLAVTAAHAAPASQPANQLPPHIVCQKDIRYGPAPGSANLLDLYLPDKVNQPLPVVVWIHGGGWAMGDKAGCPAALMIPRGFAAVSINYRLSDEATFPAQIQDCKGAIRFLRAHAVQYHIDPDRIGVWGASAGGHLVALLGTSAGSKELEGTVGGNLDQSSRVQAVCDWFGPTDMSKFSQQAQAAGIIGTTQGPQLIMQLFGGSLAEKKDLVQLANPITFIAGQRPADLPPFLIMHGSKDKTVPLAQSQLLDDALVAAGAKVDFQIIPGAGHGTGFYSATIGKTVFDFFENELKPQMGQNK